MSHHWIKFWPKDWLGDPALRSCSVAARGLWMDLLCIMHDGQPYGHLTLAGKRLTARQVGTITGLGEKQAINLLAELEGANVFSWCPDHHTMFSRRMVRDRLTSDEGRKNGKIGGNPLLKAKSLIGVKGDAQEGLTPSGESGVKHLDTDTDTEAEKKVSLRSTDARGTRITDDWWPDDEEATFAVNLGLDPSKIAVEFRDYWRGRAGKDGRKADWPATWRNRCRELADRATNRSQVSLFGSKDGRRAAGLRGMMGHD